MANSKIVITKKQPAYMAHICSRCGKPVVACIRIDVEAQKDIIFSEDKATRLANETADEGIAEQIRLINGCRSMRTKISPPKKSFVRAVAGGNYLTSMYGYLDACANCGNIEPWQKDDPAKTELDRLDEKCYPTIFMDATEVDIWARKEITLSVEIIQKSHNDNESIRKAEEEIPYLLRKLQDCDNRIDGIPEKAIHSELLSKVDEYNEKDAKLSIFNHAEKKQLGRQRAAAWQEIFKLSEVIKKKEALLFEERYQISEALLYDQTVAYGVTDSLTVKSSGNMLCYFQTPNQSKGTSGVTAELDTIVDNANMTESPVESEVIDAPVFCRKCGFKLLPNSTFCTQCGTRV